MTAMSDHLENKLLDHVLRNVAYTPPTTVYLALYTVAPTDAGGGTEVAGGSYARQAVTFGAAAAGACSNSGTVTFTNMPTVAVVAVALLDASTGGNLLYRKTLATQQDYSAGENVTVNPGTLTVTHD
jgi:hypothetical protein